MDAPTRAATTATATAPEEVWEPLAPDEARLGLRRAGHLLRRSCFGGSLSQIQRVAELPPTEAVAAIMQSHSAEENAASYAPLVERAALTGSNDAYRAWWMRTLGDLALPFRQRMVVFWCEYFGLGMRQMGDLRTFHRFREAIASCATATLDEVFQTALNHPAVLLNLQAATNRRSQPNRHIARVYLDQYSVGPDGHQESDVAELARALTGRFVVRGRIKRYAYEFDPGEKNILGNTGHFEPDDIPPLLAAQPATARNVVCRLWLHFVADELPDIALLEPLAEQLHTTRDIAAVVRRLLLSRVFYSEAAFHRRVKSPLELALGAIRALGVHCTSQVAAAVSELGFDLLECPTVQGRPAGRDWLNSFTMLGRVRLLSNVLSGNANFGGTIDWDGILGADAAVSPETLVARLEAIFLQTELPSPVREPLVSLAGTAMDEGSLGEAAARVALAIVAQPEYQLA